MSRYRNFRLVAAAAALVAVLSLGFADWSGASSSPSAYVVRPGDTLWGIATSRGLTVAQLASANRLDPNDILPIGLHLYVPGRGSGSVRPASPRPLADPWRFCSTFASSGGPWGQVPHPLAGSATYYRLRPVFEHWAAHYDLSLPLLEAVAWQESGWQQGVVSSTGAVGVGQIEPYTATFIQDYLVGRRLDIHNASDNIRMSAAFLAYLAHIEGDNRCSTIAAYYEGPLNLQTRGVLPDAQQYVADVEAIEPRFQ
ncbi:MAG TPA: transglycosylase SLT domain-containing protein [Acidimicrobiales bacterium]|nr:transglycosylase SLT domain-containing protein [Acidimicrobiales bacterium]